MFSIAFELILFSGVSFGINGFLCEFEVCFCYFFGVWGLIVTVVVWFGIGTGAKLPLYAFKRLTKIAIDKGLPADESTEPPVAFLESLVLGEVNLYRAAEE